MWKENSKNLVEKVHVLEVCHILTQRHLLKACTCTRLHAMLCDRYFTISKFDKFTDSCFGNINNLISHMNSSFWDSWFKEVWNVFLKEVSEISLKELNSVCQEVTALIFSSVNGKTNWRYNYFAREFVSQCIISTSHSACT